MGSSQDRTLIIWIDKNVNNKSTKELQNEIRKYDALKLECFDNLESGIKFIQKIKFQKTLIILSGRLYPEFHASYKQIAENLLIIPKIIIFTGNAKEYNPPNKKDLNLNDKFFNIGGVIDKNSELKKFIESNVDNFSGNYEQTIKNEELKFQIVSSQNDLILYKKTEDVYADASDIVRQAAEVTYRSVNVLLIQRNWLLGKRIVEEELGENRSDNYGKEIIIELSKKLTAEFGKGFEERNIYRFVQFYKTYPEILTSVMTKSFLT